jgi:DNA-directed RNA polymerase subunit H (RpoH/RPB5)
MRPPFPMNQCYEKLNLQGMASMVRMMETAKSNLLKLLRYRGWSVLPLRVRERKGQYVETWQTDQKGEITIHWCPPHQNFVKSSYQMFSNTYRKTTHPYVIVIANGFTGDTNHLLSKDRETERFTYKELQYFIFDHPYVPHYHLIDTLPPMFQKEHLCSMLSTDPVARALGLRKGDIVAYTVKQSSGQLNYRQIQ